MERRLTYHLLRNFSPRENYGPELSHPSPQLSWCSEETLNFIGWTVGMRVSRVVPRKGVRWPHPHVSLFHNQYHAGECRKAWNNSVQFWSKVRTVAHVFQFLKKPTLLNTVWFFSSAYQDGQSSQKVERKGSLWAHSARCESIVPCTVMGPPSASF